VEDHARDQRLGFLVPMRVAGLARWIVHQGFRQHGGVFGDIEAVGIERVHRVEGAAWLPRHAERIEHMHRPESCPCARRDAGVFSLGVDAEDGAIGDEEVGNDRTHALTGARRRDR